MRKKFQRRHQIKRKKPLLKNRFFWFSILTLFLIFGILYLFFFSEIFQIKEIKISGVEKVLEKEIRSKIQEKIQRRFLFLSTKSIFLAPLSEIKKEILQNFPKIANLRIKRIFPQGLFFEISEREAIAIWCQEGKCFSIDKEGILFEENFSKKLIEIENKKEILAIKIGEKVINKKELSKILEIQENLEKELGLLIQKFVILPDRLCVEFKEGWKAFFNLKGDINWQLLKLKIVLEEKIPSKEREKLDYIELRFGNLAPFKYKE